jgi:hypothetical protein
LLVGHAVQGEQVRDITRFEPDLAGFQPADLRPRRPDLVSSLRRREASSLAKAAKLGTKQKTKDKPAE